MTHRVASCQHTWSTQNNLRRKMRETQSALFVFTLWECEVNERSPAVWCLEWSQKPSEDEGVGGKETKQAPQTYEMLLPRNKKLTALMSASIFPPNFAICSTVWRRRVRKYGVQIRRKMLLNTKCCWCTERRRQTLSGCVRVCVRVCVCVLSAW